MVLCPIIQSMEHAIVVVTGGRGFLGSFVMEALARAPWCARAVAVRMEEYDLRRKADVERMYDDHQPSLVMHLAGRVGGIGANTAAPADFFYDNALMGIHVLHEAAVRGVAKIVTVGSVCAYPEGLPVPFREEHLWDGRPIASNEPYGISKRLLLTQGDAERTQNGLNAVHLILANLYGPRDHFDPECSHVVPALVRKCVEAVKSGQQRIVLWGDGSQTREFLYVEDAAAAIVHAADTYDAAEPVNVGSGQVISIRALASLVAEVTGYSGEIAWDVTRPSGQRSRRMDTTRMREVLKFTPSVALRDGLVRTVAWYRAQRAQAAATSSHDARPANVR